MRAGTRRSAPHAIEWQATDPPPRGWRRWLARLLADYLAELGYPRHGVTLVIGGDALLKRLNTRYRRRARSTDILSFSYLDGHALPGKASRGKPSFRAAPPLIGELAVSWPRTKAQARANGWPPRTELARLLAHGCAHLVGYDHPNPRGDEEMLAVEERLLEAAGFPPLYPESRRRVTHRGKDSRRKR